MAGTKISAPIQEQFVREMGITFSEFLRTLPSAVAPLEYRLQGRSITLNHPAGRIEILLGATRERRLGAFRLPVTPVEFRFSGLDSQQRERFLTRFDLHYQRGGG
jgi:hypothetical protein